MTESTLRRWWWPISALVITLIIGLGIGLAISPDDNAATPESAATDVDVGFAQDMSAHHQQAVMMADLMPADSAPDVRGLVNQIKAVQWREVGQMTGWLQMLKAPLQSDQSMAWMKQEGHTHTGTAPAAPDGSSTPVSMPGTASGEELTALHDATGTEAEILFLQLMIRHHQGGIDMAAYASQAAGDPDIRRAATGMVKDQSEEIGVMTVMLNQRGGQTLPYPT